ncbi:ATP-binding protein [Elusimicrobiota bacterium]
MKLHVKIAFVIFIVTVLAIGCLTFVSTKTIKAELHDDICHQLSTKATHIMDKIDKILFERLSDIKVLASNENTIFSGDKTSMNEKLEYLRRIEREYKVYASISIYDINGIRIGDTRGTGIGVNEKDSPFFAEAIKGNIYSDKRPVFSKSLGIPVIHFSAPLRGENGIIKGVVATKFPISKINHIIRSTITQEEEKVLIDLLDKEGLVLFSNHKHEDILRQRFSGLEIFEGISNSKEKMETSISMYDGTETIFIGIREQGYLDYKGNEWILIMGISASTAFAPVKDLMTRILLIGLGIIIISIPLSLLISISISKPIKELIAATRKIAAGNLDYKVNIKSKDELGQLSIAFNNMTDDLKNSTASIMELNKEVGRRKNIEAEVTESEQKYKALFEANPDGILITDIETRKYQYANPAFCNMMGYSVFEINSMNMQQIHPEDDMEYVLSEFETHAKGQSQFVENIPFLRKDGTKVYTDVSGDIISIKGRNYSVAYIRNITEKKLAEEKLERTMEKLTQSNFELEQFAYVASHDLQEPLRMIASYLGLIERRYADKLDKDANEFINYAVDGAARMQRMINDLLTYSRVASKGKEFKPVDCKEVIKQVIINLQETVKERNAEIIYDPLPEIVADDMQIARLLQNLISNAIKYNDNKKPEIHVSAEKKNNKWLFSVKDNGIGMKTENIDRIFKIFQRLHTREEFSGTGIGLAVCKKTVERHGGRIWVESELGKGSVFYFTIPYKESIVLIPA